jgi:hypothetical protein
MVKPEKKFRLRAVASKMIERPKKTLCNQTEAIEHRHATTSLSVSVGSGANISSIS